MHRHLRAAAALTAGIAAAAAVAGPAAADGDSSGRRVTVAVIGDSPYAADQVDPATFDGLIADIGADPKVRTVVHLGDIKSGSTRCDDTYFDQIAAAFARSKDPVVYTPGDNEWTDCHRTTNGAYDPYDRLAAVRARFFPEPGTTLGRRTMAVDHQEGPTVENVRWSDGGVVWSTVHVVGSDNGYLPWTGDLETPANAARREAEVAARIDAAVAWLEATFAEAEDDDAPGVVVAMQADTFVGPTSRDMRGFDEVIDALEALAADFDGDVLLLQGDTHRYKTDTPLAGAPNVTRIVVEGETVREWLRLTVDPRAAELFTWERITR